MNTYLRTIALLLWPLALIGDGDKIAFLKGNHVFVANTDGTHARQLDSDPRKKGSLRWDAANQRLGFLADATGEEMIRFVVLDLTGKVLADVAIRPPTDPPTSGMRFVEDLEWLGAGKIRVGGSINPRNCEQFDLDIRTGQESNWHAGKCSSFAESPDGKHTAHCDTVPQTDDEHRFDSILVDERNVKGSVFSVATVRYWGEDPGIFILAGPVWSPDSKHIAVIEKRASNQEAALVILTPAASPGKGAQGEVRRIPIPSELAERPFESGSYQPSLRWLGSKLVAGHGARAVAVDAGDPHSRAAAVGPQVRDQLTRLEGVRRDTEAARKRVEEVVKKLGGREGVLLSGSAAR